MKKRCDVVKKLCYVSCKKSAKTKEQQENEEKGKWKAKIKLVPKVPEFYARNQEYNNGVTDTNFIIAKFNCPMQLLYDIIKDGTDRQIPSKTANIDDVLYWGSNMIKAANLIRKNKGKQLKKILNIVKQYSEEVKTFNANEEEYFQKRSMAFSGCMKEINRYTIDQEFMIYLIHLAFNNGDICDNLLIALYNYDKNMFLKCFKATKMSKKDQKCPQNS